MTDVDCVTSSPTADQPISVTGIGSCRLYRPLRLMSAQGRIRPLHPLSGHVHNPLEILQLLRMRSGDLEIEPSLAPYLGIKNVHSFEKTKKLLKEEREADIIIVELSSIRIVQYRGWYFQINATSSYFSELGFSIDHINKMVKGREAPQELPVTDDCLALDIYHDSESWEMGREELAVSIKNICERLEKPVMFLGFFEETKGGRKIPQRQLLNEVMAEFVQTREGVEFFNPTDLVAKYGFDVALKDLGHYNLSFECTAAIEFEQRILDFAERIYLQGLCERKAVTPGATLT